ncbi:MAG: hypothetical protein HY904_06825 [Deltaproteobacteria bacterium]|nr:hypothetical protein [Deltaproteobacteria bacterium]
MRCRVPPSTALVLALWSCSGGGGGSVDAGPPAPVLADSTLDEAHVIGVIALTRATNCAVLTWCASSAEFERMDVLPVEDWVGRLEVGRLLLPQRVLETLTALFGPVPRAVYAGRVEGPDDPSQYAVTCGMDPPEPFTWPTDAHALWVLDADAERVWDLQCVLSVAETLDAFGRDGEGRTAAEVLATRPGCGGTRAQARRDAERSAARVPARAAQVSGENRCRRHDADAGT